MDSHTHVLLASRLLEICGARKSLCIVSLFPQIDRSPPTLHRMYAHTVFKTRELTEIGLLVLSDRGTETASARFSNAFAVRRFGEEGGRMLSYLAQQSWDGASALSELERDAALMAYVSHLYLDTYNQPTQPFSPESVYCSGQWKLWKELGDFRLELYTTPAIDELREELFHQAFWKDAPRIFPAILTQAMLIRMCAFSLEQIPAALVVSGMKALKFEPGMQGETKAACQFLEEFENSLFNLHIKHLGVGASVHVASPASNVYAA
ncbi:MAG TPA: hypothetical protein VN634_11370 [Candidatus Limnocylindrales bacterium]|nr:hypothetical protein [Candidatus Limnocylindrales bacterium]